VVEHGSCAERDFEDEYSESRRTQAAMVMFDAHGEQINGVEPEVVSSKSRLA
jgi:hypothetical protein